MATLRFRSTPRLRLPPCARLASMCGAILGRTRGVRHRTLVRQEIPDGRGARPKRRSGLRRRARSRAAPSQGTAYIRVHQRFIGLGVRAAGARGRLMRGSVRGAGARERLMRGSVRGAGARERLMRGSVRECEADELLMRGSVRGIGADEQLMRRSVRVGALQRGSVNGPRRTKRGLIYGAVVVRYGFAVRATLRSYEQARPATARSRPRVDDLGRR